MSIVGITVAIFFWRSWGGRRQAFKTHSGCGCFTANPLGPKPPAMTLRGRKGERARMFVKLK